MFNYIVDDFAIHWRISFRNRMIAKHDKRVLFRQFVTDLHLDKLAASNVGFVLPRSYPITTNEINYLYSIRNRIILRFHDRRYKPAQIAIDKRIDELTREHEFLKTRRASEKKALDNLNARLTKNKDDNLVRIGLESNIAKATSALANTDSAILNGENEISHLKYSKKQNYLNWEKQIKVIEDVVESAIGDYTMRATSKIQLEYGFTKYTHEAVKYDDNMTKIVKGEY